MIVGSSFLLKGESVYVMPTYLKVEDLIRVSGFDYLYDSANGQLSPYKGMLEYVGDGTEAEGNAYLPTVTEYPKNGTIDQSENGDGKGTKQINTGYIIDYNTPIVLKGAIDVIIGTSHNLYLFNYKGEGIGDLYTGNSTTDMTLHQSDVSWIPPTGVYKIVEYPSFLPSSTELSSIYVSMGTAQGTPPTGITVNVLNDGTVPSSPIYLVDEDNTSTGVTITWDGDYSETGSDGPVSGDDSGFLYDTQQKRGFYRNDADRTLTIGGLDSSHTYTIEISGGTLSSGRYVKYTMNSNDTEFLAYNNTSNGATESGITGVTSFDIHVVAASQGTEHYRYVMGINIRRST